MTSRGRPPRREPGERPGAGTAAGPDSDQLAAAYRDHRDDLHRFARRRLGPALADEAVQETFLRAWRSIHRFDPTVGTARMWLFGICRHAVVDFARKRTKDSLADMAASNRQPVAEADLEPVMARWQVGEALKRMSSPQRHAVVQVHLRDQPYADVAAELGVPVGTVKSRVHQGLHIARAACA